jgi:D-alanine-D-alanine ligase
MKKLRVLVLMHEDLVPPSAEPEKSDKDVPPWKTERDVLAGLAELGHEIKPLGVHDDLGVLREAIDSWRPDITFNLLEEFHGATIYGQAVISFLELVRCAYSGCNPRGLMLAHDKVLTKEVLAYHRVRAPRCAVYPVGRAAKKPKRLSYPLLVKSTFEDGSLGISQASLVSSDEKLEERVRWMHDEFGTDVMAEEFVEGRELYCGVLGNQRLETFPAWEMIFQEWPQGSARIATGKVKWDLAYQKKHGIETRAAKLEPALERETVRVCKQVYRALGLSGYARIDLRLTADGKLYVIEANANPDLAADEDFAQSAKAVGIEYPQLLQRILNLGLAWRPAWKEVEEAVA